MRSPEDMGIIEIDITNACVHACSNCTRHCGHHKKPFFMSFDDFKAAVDSLDDWDGLVGVIGGEPTLHPEFEKFADYIREHREKRVQTHSRGPIADMQTHIDVNVNCGKDARSVLLSSLNTTYYKHFETINDTFAYQLLNDHSNACEHQALLMSRKELGISDEEWEKKRDACWIQNTWSATITPKGAFFCEVAGALDMLFDGPGGWPVEPGWYKRKPEDFKEQLHWCEMCSGCLDVPKRLSSDEIDDVTPEMYEKLKAIGSPKANTNRCVVRKPENFDEYSEKTYKSGTEYIERGDMIRITDSNKNLLAKDCLFVSESNIAELIAEKNPKDWVAVCSLQEEKMLVSELMKKYVFNPGCFYIIDDSIHIFNVLSRSIRDKSEYQSIEQLKSYFPSDKVIYFNTTNPYNDMLGGVDINHIDDLKKRYKSIILYGAGMAGKQAVRFLDSIGWNDFIWAVSSLENHADMIMGHKIHVIDEFKEMSDDCLVIITTTRLYHDEIKDNLKRLGFNNVKIWS